LKFASGRQRNPMRKSILSFSCLQVGVHSSFPVLYLVFISYPVLYLVFMSC